MRPARRLSRLALYGGHRGPVHFSDFRDWQSVHFSDFRNGLRGQRVSQPASWLVGFEAAPDIVFQRLYRIFRFFYRRRIGLSTSHRCRNFQFYSPEATLFEHFEFSEAIPNGFPRGRKDPICFVLREFATSLRENVEGQWQNAWPSLSAGCGSAPGRRCADALAIFEMASVASEPPRPAWLAGWL